MVQTNEIIESFLKHYEQGYYFYDKLATLVADQCEKKVNESSIRAIVTSRAKKIKSLKEKIYQRHKTKNYQSETAIFEDIVDLAGVRIALYFPADRARVENFIKDIFIIIEEKPFPRPKTENEKDKDKNKFDGYHADHYRVMLKSETLEDKNKDCANYIIEIQVASILMHAWAEVNHDLAYKPSSGELSKQESSILDGLNGLVLTGEVLLEQLQSAFQERVAHQKQPFANEYELAAFINNRLTYLYDLDTSNIMINRLSDLLCFLNKISYDNINNLGNLLQTKFDINLTKISIRDRSISDLIISRIFEKNIDLFEVYWDLIHPDWDAGELKNKIKEYVKEQIILKRYIRCLAYYNNIIECGLGNQTKSLINLGCSLDNESIFICILYIDRYGGRFKTVYDINYLVLLVLNEIEQIDDPYSKKAMEWARSGQLELPEK